MPRLLPSSLPVACVLSSRYGLPRLCLPRPRGHPGVQRGAWEPPTGGPCMQSPVWQEGNSLAQATASAAG